MEQELYRYYMTQRPFMPGAQPLEGLVDRKDLDPQDMIPEIGRGAWAVLTYSRNLTGKELHDYELTPADKGYTLTNAQETDTTALFQEMYSGSWYTITGCAGDPAEWIKGYQEMMAEKEIGVPVRWVKFYGYQMNRELGLTGANRYQNGLKFLAFPLDGLDIGKLAAFKLNMRDRWFDDIVDNNLAREEELV